LRQAYIQEERYIPYLELDKLMQPHEAYKALPAKVAQQILKQLEQKQQVKYPFSGKRIKRGLYRASGKRYINADLNGAYNIIRKVAPKAFAEGVEGLVVHPLRITLTNATQNIVR